MIGHEEAARKLYGRQSMWTVDQTISGEQWQLINGPTLWRVPALTLQSGEAKRMGDGQSCTGFRTGEVVMRHGRNLQVKRHMDRQADSRDTKTRW